MDNQRRSHDLQGRPSGWPFYLASQQLSTDLRATSLSADYDVDDIGIFRSFDGNGLSGVAAR